MMLPMTPITRRLMPAAPPRSARNETARDDTASSLYEHAAGLLASAGALEAAARTPGAAVALGPTLACLEASFGALVGVTEQLGGHAVEPRSEERVRAGTRPAAWEVDRRFRDLINAVEAARVTCAYARDVVGPVQACARSLRLIDVAADAASDRPDDGPPGEIGS